MNLDQQRGTILRLLIRARDAGETVSGHALTYEHGITRYSARIGELREKGWVIETIPSAQGQASFRLVGQREDVAPPEPVQEAAFEAPAVPKVDAGGFVCANCGSSFIQVDRSRPSIDDRFAVGTCLTEAAAAEKRAKKKGDYDGEAPIKKGNLVRADLYDGVRAQRDRKKAVATRASLMKGYSDPRRSTRRMSKDDMAKAQQLVAELLS
jgi:hypothetical protein